MPPAKLDERPSRVAKKGARYQREAKALGGRVRSLREARGWTLEQAAERSQIDWKHWQKIEAGLLNVTLVTLVRMAVGLGVEMRALFEAKKPQPS
jgi:transcriptional regulator with XRE-family HTH domain